MTQAPTGPNATARSFIYTAAPFGHEGINGFQFVGLPVGGSSADLIDFLAGHIGYTAPLGVPSQPDAAQIEALYPKSTRILPNGPNGTGVLIHSVYVGQVYQDHGARGKWGNFLGHALVFDAPPPALDMIAMAADAPWREALTEEELARGKALDLPDLAVSASAAPPAARLTDAERAGAVAAILARLDGDAPLLLEDTHPDVALATIRTIAASLDPRLLARLRWSSFEFDGSADYDVLATFGDTRLARNASDYHRLTAVPDTPALIWAGEAACREGPGFWSRLGLFCDLAAGDQVGKAAALLMAVEQATHEDLAPVLKALAVIREGPPDRPRLGAAEMIFARGFGALAAGVRANDFAFLIGAFHEAAALDKWSRSGVYRQKLTDWAQAFPSVAAAFDARSDAGPLRTALARAVASGCAVDEVVEAALVAADSKISDGADLTAFAEALYTTLADAGQVTDAVLLVPLGLSPGGEKVLAELLMRAAQGASLEWLAAISAALRRQDPVVANRLLPSLELALLDRHSRDAAQAVEVGRTLASLDTQTLEQHPDEVRGILARLDSALPRVGSSAQARPEQDWLALARDRNINDRNLPNALALEAAASDDRTRQVLKGRGKDSGAFDSIAKGANKACYIAFFDRAWEVVDPPKLADARSDALQLYRNDIREHFVNKASRHFSKLSGRTRAADRLADALTAYAAATRASTAEDDWALVAENVALKLCTRLTEGEFDELAQDHRGMALIDRLARRRSRTVGAVAKSIAEAVRGLFGRRDGRD